LAYTLRDDGEERGNPDRVTDPMLPRKASKRVK